MKKAVITLNVIDEYGEKVTCNMIESLEVTMARVCGRIEQLSKSHKITGNITIQFVEEE